MATKAALAAENEELKEELDKLRGEMELIKTENEELRKKCNGGINGVHEKLDELINIAKDTNCYTKAAVDCQGQKTATYAAVLRGSMTQRQTAARPRPPVVTPLLNSTTPQISEAEDRAKHASGLVVTGLRETDNADEDKVAAQMLINACADGIEVMRTYRMPATPRPDGKPRLLKVLTASADAASAVLRNARRLKNHDEFEGVYIRRSMPLVDRIALRNLRLRAAQLNETTPINHTYFVLPNTAKLCRKIDGINDFSYHYQGN